MGRNNKYPQKEKRKSRSSPQANLKLVKSRTRNQSAYLSNLIDPGVPIVFGSGPAGSGKTLLAVYAAAKSLYDGTVRKIVLTRPVVEAGENLGFLPGTLEEKIDPYMKPLFDSFLHCFRQQTLDAMFNKKLIEVCPLAFMRGRTFTDAYIILDEAQNASEEQIKMMLTRLGDGTQLTITGDPDQSDIRGSGLKFWTDLLEHEHYVAVTKFTTEDNQRRPEVAALLRKYYDSK